MCRQNQLWGWALVAFGVGELVGMLLESGFFGLCLGIGAVLAGVCVIRRK